MLFCQITTDIFYIIGKNEILEISSDLAGEMRDISEHGIFHIVNSSGTYDFIPQLSPDLGGGNIKLHLQDNIREAGNYTIKSNGNQVSGVSFNYNRRESDLSYYVRSELNEIVARQQLRNFTLIETESDFITHELKQISQGKQYWKLFVILTLVFLAIEIALIRFWK